MTHWIDAAFVRGGTSKGLYFRADALPELDTAPAPGTDRDTSAWDAIFCSALGSRMPSAVSLMAWAEGSPRCRR